MDKTSVKTLKEAGHEVGLAFAQFRATAVRLSLQIGLSSDSRHGCFVSSSPPISSHFLLVCYS